jgi:hypothetical protein
METNPTKRRQIHHQNGTSGWIPEEILLVCKITMPGHYTRQPHARRTMHSTRKKIILRWSRKQESKRQTHHRRSPNSISSPSWSKIKWLVVFSCLCWPGRCEPLVLFGLLTRSLCTLNSALGLLPCPVCWVLKLLETSDRLGVSFLPCSWVFETAGVLLLGVNFLGLLFPSCLTELLVCLFGAEEACRLSWSPGCDPVMGDKRAKQWFIYFLFL